MLINEQDKVFTQSEWNSIFVGSLFSALCIFFSYFGYTVMASILTMGFALFANSRSKMEKFYLVGLAIPNTRAMEFMGVSGAICICSIYAILELTKRRKIDRKIFVLIVLYAIYNLQFLIRYSSIQLGIIMPFKAVLVVLFILFFTNEEEVFFSTISIIYKAALFFYTGIVVAALTSFIIRERGGRFQIINNDPNILSIEIAFVLGVFSICFFRLEMMSTRKYMIFTISLICLSVMCGSRGGLLLIGFVITESLLLNIYKINKFIFLLFFIVLGLIVIFVSDFGQTAVKMLINRSQALVNNNNFSNGRIELWKQYIGELSKNKMLWFLGMGDYSLYGMENVAHNFLIEDIAGNGIIGTGLIYYIYIVLFRKAIHNILIAFPKRKCDSYFLLPFVCPILGGIVLHGLTSIPNTYMLFLGSFVIALGYKYTNKNCTIKITTI